MDCQSPTGVHFLCSGNCCADSVTGCTQRGDSAVSLLLLTAHHLVSSQTCLLLFHLHTHTSFCHTTQIAYAHPTMLFICLVLYNNTQQPNFAISRPLYICYSKRCKPLNLQSPSCIDACVQTKTCHAIT